MNRTRHKILVSLSLSSAIFSAQIAKAINTVFVPSAAAFGGGNLEVQGFNGRLDLPLQIQQAPTNPFPVQFLGAVAGSAANVTTLYTLVNDRLNATDDSFIVMNDAQTGAYLGQVLVNARFSDIAYTNGQLYGVLPNQNALQIDSVAANGNVQSVVNASEPSFTGNWVLSGVVTGNNLLASHAVPAQNAVGYLVSPTLPQQVSPITVYGVSPGPSLAATVFSQDGNIVTSIYPVGVQTMTSLPSDTSSGVRTSTSAYGLNSSQISDEFNDPYPPSQPAFATLATSNPKFGTDGLFRVPQVVTASDSIYLANGIAPDGVTLSNVSATKVLTQTGGPTLITITEQDDPSGNFSYRSLGTANISLNLATAQRGLYQLSTAPTITADYSYGTTTDVGRAVQIPHYGPDQFGYDPISSNIVGNGDASLDATGWESRLGDTGSWISQALPVGPKGFFIFPPFASSDSIRQILQLPTSNGPMLLSFTGQLDSNIGSSSPVEVQVDINGKLVDDVFINSASAQQFSTEIIDPSLENLSGAILQFHLPTNPTAGAIDLDNITLTAVPEPASVVSGLFLGGLLLSRRKASPMRR